MPSKTNARQVCWVGLIALTMLGVAHGASTTAPSTQPSVSFVNGDAAKAAIIDDSAEPYFDLLQPGEMSAKTGKPITGDTLAAQRAECRRRYQAATRDFTAAEQQTLRWYIARIQPLVARGYPLFANTPWNFLKVSEDLEAGWPHTRGKYIVLTSGFIDHLEQFRKSESESQAIIEAGDVLVHEQCHVFQRAHPKLMADLYTHVWKFTRADHIEGCPWLTQHQMLNPDGVQCPWVYPIAEAGKTRWIWPLIILNDPNGAMTADNVRAVAISLDRTAKGFAVKVDAAGKPEFVDLDSVTAYTDAFPGCSDNYHPNELDADSFAMVVMLDKLISDMPQAAQNPAIQKQLKSLEPMRDWSRRNLAAAP